MQRLLGLPLTATRPCMQHATSASTQQCGQHAIIALPHFSRWQTQWYQEVTYKTLAGALYALSPAYEASCVLHVSFMGVVCLEKSRKAQHVGTLPAAVSMLGG